MSILPDWACNREVFGVIVVDVVRLAVVMTTT